MLVLAGSASTGLCVLDREWSRDKGVLVKVVQNPGHGVFRRSHNLHFTASDRNRARTPPESGLFANDGLRDARPRGGCLHASCHSLRARHKRVAAKGSVGQGQQKKRNMASQTGASEDSDSSCSDYLPSSTAIQYLLKRAKQG